MRQVRTSAEIRQGERVEMLFTPRLYMFKGEQGATLDADTTDLMQVYSLYADIMFLAALNLWTLEGKPQDEAPFSRADFHEFSAADPKAFGKVLNFALAALTGKEIKDFIADNAKAPQTDGKQANEGGESKKKDSCRLLTRILRLFS